MARTSLTSKLSKKGAGLHKRCGEQRGPARVSSASSTHQHELGVSRFIGLSVGGAKSDRTCLTIIDYYRKQEKSFVVDIFEGICADNDRTADEVLFELLKEIKAEGPAVKIMAVDAPLSFPPCAFGCEESCQGYDRCKRPAVRWMRTQYTKEKAKNHRLKHFTPYGQRPVDLYFRYKFPEENLFQDETMGANLAPQAVRMNYLKKHLDDQLVEVWPKLALYSLHKPLKISKREILDYRNLERGAGIRQKLIDKLSAESKMFIYERDMKKFLTNVSAFDSLVCAWVALLTDLERVVQYKSDLPIETGWVQVPQL
jgi:hypothetical protein